MNKIFSRILTNEYKIRVDHGKTKYEPEPFFAPDKTDTGLDDEPIMDIKDPEAVKAGYKAQGPLAKVARNYSNTVRSYTAEEN